jgi:group I intron endonuclease
MKLPRIAGIYKITNTLNGLYYVGSTVNIKKRHYGHFSKLRVNKHANFHLQAAFNKYGESSFRFEIVEECLGMSIEELRAVEQKYLDAILDWHECYNMVRIANHLKALPPIKESTRQKMSLRRGVANPNFGKKHPEELKLEMAEVKRVRGSGVYITDTNTWKVNIKLLGDKTDTYLGTYADEAVARMVKSLAEKLYWDNDISVKGELDALKLTAITNTVNARKCGTGVVLTPDGTWKVLIGVNHTQIYLGIYKTEQLARTVRSLAEKVYWDNDESLLPELEAAKLQANTPHNQKHYGGGVVFDKRRGDWLARIRLNGKTVQVGTFKTEAEAKERRVQAEKYYYDGDESFAYLFNKPKKEKALPTGVQLRDNGKYRAVININNKRHTLGTFTELEDAIAARLAAEQSLLS